MSQVHKGVFHNDVDAWVARFENLPGLRRFHAGVADELRPFLAADLTDAFATSLAYYQLTGRKGLWIYRYGQGVLMVCLHPHVDSRLLIFPPLGKGGPGLLPIFCDIVPFPLDGIQLARFRNFKTYMSGCLRLSLRVIQEPILDWLFPCHILSASTVASAAMHGKHFSEIRRRIRQAAEFDVDIVSFPDFMPDVKDIRHLWADNKHVAQGPTGSDQYYEELFSGRLDFARLRGHFYKVHGVVEGFTIWELPYKRNGQVVSLAHIVNHSIAGLSEFGMHAMCCELHAQGYERVNVGGSEDAGLDMFKRKFAPVKSYRLFSADVLAE